LPSSTICASPVPPVSSRASWRGQRLGLESGGFDAVLSSFGIFLFPDRLASWREAARMLRPGGLFVTSVWRGPEQNALARLQMAPLMAALPARLKDPPPLPAWLGIMTPKGLVQEVTAAAPFVEPSVSVVNATLAMPSPAAMWRAMKGNPVTNRLLLACSASERDDVERAMLAHFEATAGGPDRPLLFDASCHVLIVRRA
jgi:SAM-dependent methyltransferase